MFTDVLGSNRLGMFSILTDPIQPESSFISKLKRNLETEKVIKDVWSKILHKNDISVEDNFFAIGGHSFYVIEVVFQLKNLLILSLL